MNAVVGTLLLALSVVLFACAYIAYRRPSPSRWTEWELLSQLIVIFDIALLATGVGFIGRTVAGYAEHPLGTTNLAGVAGILAVATLAMWLLVGYWRRLNARPAEPAAIVSTGPMPPTPTPANRPGAGGPSPSQASGGRRAAKRRAA